VNGNQTEGNVGNDQINLVATSIDFNADQFGCSPCWWRIIVDFREKYRAWKRNHCFNSEQYLDYLNELNHQSVPGWILMRLRCFAEFEIQPNSLNWCHFYNQRLFQNCVHWFVFKVVSSIYSLIATSTLISFRHNRLLIEISWWLCLQMSYLELSGQWCYEYHSRRLV